MESKVNFREQLIAYLDALALTDPNAYESFLKTQTTNKPSFKQPTTLLVNAYKSIRLGVIKEPTKFPFRLADSEADFLAIKHSPLRIYLNLITADLTNETDQLKTDRIDFRFCGSGSSISGTEQHFYDCLVSGEKEQAFSCFADLITSFTNFFRQKSNLSLLSCFKYARSTYKSVTESPLVFVLNEQPSFSVVDFFSQNNLIVPGKSDNIGDHKYTLKAEDLRYRPLIKVEKPQLKTVVKSSKIIFDFNQFDDIKVEEIDLESNGETIRCAYKDSVVECAVPFASEGKIGRIILSKRDKKLKIVLNEID